MPCDFESSHVLLKIDSVLSICAAKLENLADYYWDKFYKFHADRFFNDRHWFSAEFPALLTASAVLEVGCGVGNTIFPLLEINSKVHVYACDFAATAIKIVHQHPEYTSSKRVTAFVADLINDDMLQNVPRGIVDACTMIFVLSAISPEAMPAAVANVKQTLIRRRAGSDNGNGIGGRGGQILFRDYADGDLAQERLQLEHKQQRIGEGFYMRGDGTRAFYFTENFVLDLFEQQGFRCEELVLKDMVKVNRSTGITMGRKFLHGVFTLIEVEKKDQNSSVDGDGAGGENGGKETTTAWIPYKDSCKDSSADIRKQSIETPRENEHSSENSIEIVELSNGMAFELENYSKENSDCASKVLAEVVLRCPELFHDTNIVQVRCGGGSNGGSSGETSRDGSGGSFGGMPLFAALRWCRRALATDQRRDAVEIFRKNAVRNGWRFAYEKLRVAVEPESNNSSGGGGGENTNWAAAAFQGPINGVLACIESQDSLIMVKEVLLSASKVLPKGNSKGFVLLVGPRNFVSSSSGDGRAVVAIAGEAGLEACDLSEEVVKAIEGVDMAENSVVCYRSVASGCGSPMTAQ
jgi:SAM-dependent methyltransferase